MATLTLTPTSGTIQAVVSGLDPAYLRVRTFVWYLNGTVVKTEAAEGGIDSKAYTMIARFETTHTVKVEIFNPEEVLLASLSGSTTTLSPSFTQWNWWASNGEATRDETLAALDALQNKELTSNFSRLVWNDLAAKTIDMVEQLGFPWVSSYGSKESILMNEGLSPLTAARFNALVVNINYLYWSWKKRPDLPGYLGREYVRGASSYGANADNVYGHYLIELARHLNNMMDIWSDSGDLSRLDISTRARLRLAANGRADRSAVCARDLYQTLDIYSEARACHSAPATVCSNPNMTIEALLIAEAYSLLYSRHVERLKINAPLVYSQSAPHTINAILPLTFTTNIEFGNPCPIIVESVPTLNFDINLDEIGMASITVNSSGLLTMTGSADTQQSAAFDAGASVHGLVTLSKPSGVALPPCPMWRTTVASLLSVPPATAGIGVPVGISDIYVEATHSVEGVVGYSEPTGIPSASVELTQGATAELGNAEITGCKIIHAERLFSNSTLARVSFKPLSASMRFGLQISAGMDGEESEKWHEQIGTEMMIWRTYQRRQRSDIVFIDSPAKPAEMVASENVSIGVAANPFVSRGWEFPKRLPDSDGRILLLKQTKDPLDADHWGKLREGEFDIWKTKQRRQRDDIVFIDSPPVPVEMSVEVNVDTETTANPFISRGWEFPKRLPDSDGRILLIKQTKVPCVEDYWGKIVGDELALEASFEQRDLQDKLFIDNPATEADLTANVPVALDAVGSAIAEEYWDYPDVDGRILSVDQVFEAISADGELLIDYEWEEPVNNGRILEVEQAMGATQTDDNLEVD